MSDNLPRSQIPALPEDHESCLRALDHLENRSTVAESMVLRQGYPAPPCDFWNPFLIWSSRFEVIRKDFNGRANRSQGAGDDSPTKALINE